jgi:RimJ/RimL family protein N-acetyltransferase
MSLFTSKTITLPDGTEVLLRSPELDDAPRLIAYLDAVRRETAFLMWGPDDDLPTEEAERDWVRSRREETGVTILAEAGGSIVSVCGVDRHGPFTKARHCAELGISIVAAWCNRGLGHVLMRELVAWAEACPVLDVVALGVIDGNERAMSLYRKHGFEATGRKRWRIKRGDDYVDEIVMSRWVGAPEVLPVCGSSR